jgi:metallo-beta-lactamase superfamily protein
MATKAKRARKTGRPKGGRPRARRRPAGGTGGGTAAAAANDVTVRMFCQGLGDGFLITIPQTGMRPYSILIDFGVAQGTPSAETIMRQAVAKIAELTQGVIDLVVLTHEHWDHVSGYVLAADALKTRLTFKHLWVAWTEKRGDPLADELRAKYAKAKVALARAFRTAASRRAFDETTVERLQALKGILAFAGLGAAARAAAGSKRGTVEDAMALPHELVKEKANPGAVTYLEPGACPRLPDATGFAAGLQAFVLGPPRNRKLLLRMDPKETGDEAYEKKKGDPPGLSDNWAWMASAMSGGRARASLAGDEDLARSRPFDSKLGMALADAEQDPFFEGYFSKARADKERRIDGDWLWTGAQHLALRMDTYTNNTCLVLAFELPASKRILLFAADAQVGNWLSWHDQPYKVGDRTLTAADLLAHTTLYKVGHHGSHNATLKEKGLELMTHPDLVAMLPVEADGVTRLGYGQMPLKSLMNALREKTAGRILRLDETWDKDKAPGTWKALGIKAALSTERITVGPPDRLSKRPLYMELTLRDG